MKIELFLVVQIILYGMGMWGVWLNNHGNKNCFKFWWVTNLGWAVIDYRSGLYIQSALFVTYFVLAVHGYLKWIKRG